MSVVAPPPSAVVSPVGLQKRRRRPRKLVLASLALNVALLAIIVYWISAKGGCIYALEQLHLVRTSFRPAGWQAAKASEFADQPHLPHATVFLGDSITAAAPLAEYFGQTRNRGRGGDTTDGVLQRLDEAVQNKPSKVLINIGTNDLSKEIQPAELLGNYAKIVRRIHESSPGAKLYLISILPISLRVESSVALRKKQVDIVEVNRGVAQLAASIGAKYIDAYTPLIDAQGELRPELTTDGLHLTPRGYEIYCEALRSAAQD